MDLPWEIGSLLAGGAAVIGLIWALRNDRNTRFLEFIKDVDKEIADHIKNDEKLENNDECVTHAYVYLEILDRIVFLLEKKKIPKEFSEYYRNYFNYGATMLIWYIIAWQDKHTLEENWPSLIGWFKINILHPYPLNHLPSMLGNRLEELKAVEEAEQFIEKITKKKLEDSIISELNNKALSEVASNVKGKS